jgi:hypothetical protein
MFMGITCFADADKRRTKNKCNETFTCFLRLIAAPVAVTYEYSDKGEREKRESYGRYEMKTIFLFDTVRICEISPV